MEESGWLNINKPINCTSAKAVAIIKSITKAKKVGHGGTLDPLATGVLPICINKATKQVENIMNHAKEYKFHLTFGEHRDTYDSEGKIIEKNNFIPNILDIKKNLNLFIGEIEQAPPAFSALKINGKRACDLAREGKNIILEKRKIIIYDIICNDFVNENTIEFIVRCGRGCYIRSLAVDIAKQLNALGYVSKLIRTKVNNFYIENSLDLENVNLELVRNNLIVL